MQPQQIADRAESEALARFLAMRGAFQPCWGVLPESRVVTRVRRRRRRVH